MADQMKKPRKKFKLFNIVITDEIAADMREIRKDGIVFQPLLRRAIEDLIRRHKNGEKVSVPNL